MSSLRPSGGPREASPCGEDRRLQPGVHLRAHGGGRLLPGPDGVGQPLRPRAAHLPPGPCRAGLLLSGGGGSLLLFSQVRNTINQTAQVSWQCLGEFQQRFNPFPSKRQKKQKLNIYYIQINYIV